jgi:hypothetical protein
MPKLCFKLLSLLILCCLCITPEVIKADGGDYSNEMPFVFPRICDSVYANSVVHFFQGNKKNYSSIPGIRSNPANALGAPQNDDTNNFVSLGFGGGYLTVAFQKAIVNGPGDDIFLTETSFGNPNCSSYPEKAKIYAAQNLTDWFYLGETCLDGSVDLGPLQWAKYVRIQDSSNRESSRFPGGADGFDVDGIRGIYCPRGPVIPIFECLTNDYDEDGIPDGQTSAVFGYKNLNLHRVDIAFSEFNTFLSDPKDRGQDIFFNPGRKKAAFATPIGNSSITWTVKFPLTPIPQLRATASPNSRKKCSTFVNPKRVRPVFECYLPGEEDAFSGYFGYLNENAYPVEIPAGISNSKNSNKFNPNPKDRGQPSIFESGRVYGAFSVESANGGNQVWTLEYEDTGRRTSTAGTQGRQCSAPYPSLDCVERLSDGTYRARFGYTNPEAFVLNTAAGAKNSVAPGAVDQGQPTAFQPGTHLDSYQPIFAGDESRTWTLHGAELTASATDEKLRCEPVKQPECSLSFTRAPRVASLQNEEPQDELPSTSVACQGFQTNVPLYASVGFEGDVQSDSSQLEYQWEVICDDDAATINNDDTLSPTVALFAPGTEVGTTQAGSEANCKVVLTVSHDDPLSEDAVCEANISVSACDFDCAGEIDGEATLDECGKCDGDNTSCAGCDGVPNSGIVFDECGECGGDGSSCAPDCLGVPGGTATFDQCGQCNGDGTSCLGCEEVEVTTTQYSLDGGARNQNELLKKAARIFVRTAKNKKRARRIVRKALRAGQALYIENWTLSWQVPSTVQTCTNTAFCTQNNQIGEALDEYNKKSDGLRQLALDIIKRIKPRGKRALKRRKVALRKAVVERHEKNLESSALIPRTNSSCTLRL